VGLVVVAGCGGSSHQSTSPTSPTKQTSKSQSTNTPAPPRIAAGRVLTSFSGSGNRKLGSLTEKRTTVLEWSATKPPMQIHLSNGFLLLNSNARTGRVRLLRGTYPGVRVATRGPWTIRLRAAR
jgi:hypothetical protein